MDSPLKQRLIGAAVLAALAIIFLPMLLKGPDVKEPDAAEVPLSMPATPGEDFETRELPLTTPEATPSPGGVLGMPKDPATDASVPESAVPEANPVEAAKADGSAVTGAEPSASAPTAPVAPVAPKPAAPAPASASPAEAARVGAGDIVVNVGSFSNLASANALAGKLRAAGLPVIAEKVQLASGNATRLRLGPFASRAAAEAARVRADAISGGTSQVLALDAPAPVASPTAAGSKPAAVTTPAPKPAAATPAPVKPAASASGFAVQLSAPSVEAEANALRDRARAAGFNCFVQKIETDKGTRYRVRVGPVADRAAAESLRDAVNGKLGTAGYVTANP